MPNAAGSSDLVPAMTGVGTGVEWGWQWLDGRESREGDELGAENRVPGAIPVEILQSAPESPCRLTPPTLRRFLPLVPFRVHLPVSQSKQRLQ